MTRKIKDMVALSRLTEAVFAAGQARMGLLKQRESDLRAQLDGLDRARSTRAGDLSPEDIALRAGADLLWQQWVDARRSALNVDLARTLAAIEKARRDLSTSFGRREATKALLDHGKVEQERLRQQRLEG